MTHYPTLGRLMVPLAFASLLASAAACANKSAPPPDAPVFTSAETPAMPPPLPAAPVSASPNVSVSAEVAATCKLRFGDVDGAPKFDFDDSKLGPVDDSVLSQIAACVTTGPLAGRSLDLIGRADPRGEAEYNMALGDRRASAVRDYLQSLGVDLAKLSESSRGNLDATGTEEIGWQRDRRVDVNLH